MSIFTNQLLRWYNQNKRNLPWRATKDPYKIWISEIILQQTRIDQGTDYYLNFIKTFPNVQSLAKSGIEKVLKQWQGLGYYSRARNLHQTAIEIVNHFHGQIPDEYEKLIKLKGIGDYTAGAILSIAFNKPYPVVDGNVIRVITRVLGITQSVSDQKVIKKIRDFAEKMMPPERAGEYNQALMEFGALHCKPLNPLCHTCPVQSICLAYKKKIVDEIPKKKAEAKIKDRFLNYFLIRYSSSQKKIIYLKKRTENDIWNNLYDLPCIETKIRTSLKHLMGKKEWKETFNENKFTIKKNTTTVVHKLSHQNLHAVFYDMTLSQPLKKKKNIIETNITDLHKYPVPRLIENFLSGAKLL